MNPLLWWLGGGAAVLTGAGSLFLYWYNPFDWTGPQMPIERYVPLDGDARRGDKNDRQNH